MRERSLLRTRTFILLALLIASVVAIGTVTMVSADPTKVSVDPPRVTGISSPNKFTVDINVTNALVGVFSWEVNITYNPSVLNITDPASDIIKGNFFLPRRPWTIFAFATGPGYAEVGEQIFVGSSITGSGVLFTINFTVIGTGSTGLRIGEYASGMDEPHNWLIDDYGNKIPHDSYDGHFRNVSPIHDAAVMSLFVDPDTVIYGQNVSVKAYVTNEGTYNEGSIGVTLKRGITTIDTTTISLNSLASANVSFSWNTTGLWPGTYDLTVEVSVSGDGDSTDDAKTKPVTILGADPAVISIVSLDQRYGLDQVYPAWIVHVNVTVKNKGNALANFTVTAYYDNNAIGSPQIVTNLGINYTKKLTFILTGTDWGLYDIKANITASGTYPDVNATNNELVLYNALKVKMPGDTDGNGDCKTIDASRFAATWWKVIGQPDYNEQCDFDGNGDVKTIDASIFAANWWTTTNKYPPDP